jgi:hypothetical protein
MKPTLVACIALLTVGSALAQNSAGNSTMVTTTVTPLASPLTQSAQPVAAGGGAAMVPAVAPTSSQQADPGRGDMARLDTMAPARPRHSSSRKTSHAAAGASLAEPHASASVKKSAPSSKKAKKIKKHPKGSHKADAGAGAENTLADAGRPAHHASSSGKSAKPGSTTSAHKRSTVPNDGSRP